MISFRRLPLILALLSCVMLAVITGCISQEKESYMIGIINPNLGAKAITESFIDSMGEYGYKEGENTTYITIKDKKAIDASLAQMVEQKVNLIMTVTTPATRKAKKATEKTDIPVVFVMHDPVTSGIVKDLASPENKLTGVQLRGSTPKALEWLLAAAPATKKIFVPISYDTKAARQSLSDLQAASSKLGVSIILSEVTSPEELQASLDSIPEETGAIFIVHSILINSNLDMIQGAALGRNIPVASSGHEHYKKGLVISYGHRNDHVGKQVSRLGSKLLKKTREMKLPVENADYFLGINLQTANKIGLIIPETVLRQADFIVR